MLLVPCDRWNLLVTDNLPITLLWLALYVLTKVGDINAAHVYETTGKIITFIRGNFNLPVFRQKAGRQNIPHWTVVIITRKCVYTVKFVFPLARSNLAANRENWVTVHIQTKPPLLWIQIFICTKFLISVTISNEFPLFQSPNNPHKLELLQLRKFKITLFFYGSTALVGQGLSIIEVSGSHSATPHSVGHLWTSDRPVADTCYMTGHNIH